jgi:hypothetical protein
MWVMTALSAPLIQTPPFRVVVVLVPHGSGIRAGCLPPLFHRSRRESEMWQLSRNLDNSFFQTGAYEKA